MVYKHKFTNSLASDIALLILRLSAGGIMLFRHGYTKLEKVVAGPPYEFRDPIGLGSDISLYLALFAEVVCTFLIIIGFGTRLATIPLIITMGVVAFIVHINDGFFAMELPLLYLSMYIAILILGPGKFALSNIRKSKH